MQKKIISFSIGGFFLLFFAGSSIFNFQTEKFLNKKSIKFVTQIHPKFNPKVENYYTSDCIDNNVQIEIDPKLDFKKEVKKPITIISISYNKIFNKKYYFTCVDEKVAPIIVTNAEGKRNEFNLSDEIVVGGQANGQYNGSNHTFPKWRIGNGQHYQGGC